MLWSKNGSNSHRLMHTTSERHQTRQKRKHDALTLLQRDHEQAQGLYEGFQTAGGDDRYFLASRILRLLELHARLEEELFYPAIQAKSQKEGSKIGQESVQAALRNHRAIAKLIVKVRDRMAQDEGYHAQIDNLMDQVRHHVEEEERQVFPLARTLLNHEELLHLAENFYRMKEEVASRLAA